MTELLLARSFGNLKQSAVRASSRSLRSVGGTIKEHPFAIAGTAAGAGIILYGLYRILTRNASGRRDISAERVTPSRQNLMWDLASMLVPVVTPYLTAYVEKYLGRKFSGGRG